MARKFRQNAKGYGPSTLTANVQLDGQVIFDGSVETINGPAPGENFGHTQGVNAWEWDELGTWTGSKILSITVQGIGVLQLNQTFAMANVSNAIAADNWVAPYVETIETQAGNIDYADPLSNVIIGGIAQFNHREQLADAPGQWGWNIPGGQTMTAVFTCNMPAKY